MTEKTLMSAKSLTTILLAIAVHSAPGAEPKVVLENAMNYLRGSQEPDGSFGRPQAHLRIGLTMLSLLSLEATPGESDVALLKKGTKFLLKSGSSGGDLGDDVFNTESHAIALCALICGQEFLPELGLRTEVSERIRRAARHLQRLQDRSTSSAARGGWKMEGRKGRANDRRASGWALVAYRCGRLYGLEVPEANNERALRFMLGSFKEKSDKPDQIGGFSVDTEGLAVDLISSMGGWVLSRFGGEAESRKKNLAWLKRHPPSWSGPNYFFSAFFRTRVLKFEDPSGELYKETCQRLLTQIADHQQSDGSVTFPPGNAQNTVAMGPVFSTAMSILILNAADSRLPFDEDYRLKPRF